MSAKARTVQPHVNVADVIIAASLWGLVEGLRMRPPVAVGLASAAWVAKMIWEADKQ